MQSALEFAVAAQLHYDDLVDAEAHQIEGLVALVFLVHFERAYARVTGVWLNCGFVVEL
jgi:hypothetical protein